MPERRFIPDWKERNWGEITTQDYENITRVQAGMQGRRHDEGLLPRRLTDYMPLRRTTKDENAGGAT